MKRLVDKHQPSIRQRNNGDDMWKLSRESRPAGLVAKLALEMGAGGINRIPGKISCASERRPPPATPSVLLWRSRFCGVQRARQPYSRPLSV
jgi:hypothetical protein